MFPGYEDVTSRIAEKPSWYTSDGYPRYGEFKPAECDIYCRHSILFLIQCQGCHEPFLIGHDFDRYDEHRWLVVDKKGEEHWVSIKYSLYANCKLDDDGKEIVKTLTLPELVDSFGFGDPPNHGCVGDTMGCILRGPVQVWDRKYGQVVEDGLVKIWGEPKRITELEYQEREISWLPKDQVALLGAMKDLVPQSMQ